MSLLFRPDSRRSRTFRPLIRIALLAFLAAFMIPAQSSAVGFGGYFEYLHGEGEVDFIGLDDFDFDADKFGVGFVLDTNLAKNRLFNYRMTLGYQRSNREIDSRRIGPLIIDPGDFDADGFSFNNAFGLALSRGPKHRLWAGPAIRLGVDVFDTRTDLVDIFDISVGGGPVLGLNLHASKNLTIGLAASYQYLYIEEVVSIDGDGFDQTEDFSGHEHLVSLNITFFFRTSGDQFD